MNTINIVFITLFLFRLTSSSVQIFCFLKYIHNPAHNIKIDMVYRIGLAIPQYNLSDNAAAAVVVDSPSMTSTILGKQHRLETKAEESIHFPKLFESSEDGFFVSSSIEPTQLSAPAGI